MYICVKRMYINTVQYVETWGGEWCQEGPSPPPIYPLPSTGGGVGPLILMQFFGEIEFFPEKGFILSHGDESTIINDESSSRR